MKRITPFIAIGLMATACTTGAGGATGNAVAPTTCHSSRRWAVGDSITAGVLGVAGWPNQPPAYGNFANLGYPGSKAKDIIPWIEAEVAACSPDQRPTEVVFAAGINDLDTDVTLTDMEANVTDLVTNLGVPVRLISLQPYPVDSQVAGHDADRRAFNAWMADTYPDLYTDCSTPMEGPDGWLLPEYNYDGIIHLTNAGAFELSACIMAGES
jgi:lysophospholipase L1-like esterase